MSIKMDNKKLYFVMHILLLIIIQIFTSEIGQISIIVPLGLGLYVGLKYIDYGKKIIYFILLYNFMIPLFISNAGISNSANYLIDVVLFVLAFKIYKQSENKPDKFKIIQKPMIAILLFSLVCLISVLINGGKIALILWAYRNTFRFYIFFVGAYLYLDTGDIEMIFNLFQKLFMINLIVILIQNYIFSYNGDNLGGIFGTGAGCNAPLNLFLCIVLTLENVKFVRKEEGGVKYVYYLISSSYIAALSELKLLYFEIAIIVIVAIIINRTNLRTGLTILVTVISLIAGINILINLYGFSDFFSIEGIIRYAGAGGYSTKNSINRLTAIQQINSIIFSNNIQKLIGIGFGNAEVSQFTICCSEFYQKYGLSLLYNWIHYAFLYIEIGLLGLIAYCNFFVQIGLKTLKNMYKNKINPIVFIISLISVVQLLNNISLRIESSGYMVFLVLSFIVILEKCEKGEKNNVSIN